ncbi:MAG: hypothetical protein HQM13_04460 [SAR324 cluster bacterium]|nr:hypothetical protein [SAR324 cluster bacterium]
MQHDNQLWQLLPILAKKIGYDGDRITSVLIDHRHIIFALRIHDGESAGILASAHVMKAKQSYLHKKKL